MPIGAWCWGRCLRRERSRLRASVRSRSGRNRRRHCDSRGAPLGRARGPSIESVILYIIFLELDVRTPVHRCFKRRENEMRDRATGISDGRSPYRTRGCCDDSQLGPTFHSLALPGFFGFFVGRLASECRSPLPDAEPAYCWTLFCRRHGVAVVLCALDRADHDDDPRSDRSLCYETSD
jgi:hypothetical protein